MMIDTALIQQQLDILRADHAEGLKALPEIEAERERLAKAQADLERSLDVYNGAIQALEQLLAVATAA